MCSDEAAPATAPDPRTTLPPSFLTQTAVEMKKRDSDKRHHKTIPAQRSGDKDWERHHHKHRHHNEGHKERSKKDAIDDVQILCAR